MGTDNRQFEGNRLVTVGHIALNAFNAPVTNIRKMIILAAFRTHRNDSRIGGLMALRIFFCENIGIRIDYQCILRSESGGYSKFLFQKLLPSAVHLQVGGAHVGDYGCLRLRNP